MPAMTDLTGLVDQLVSEREQLEARIAAIDQTLADLRKRLATTPGARSGKNARSGRRRKGKQLGLSDVTDLRPEVAQ